MMDNFLHKHKKGMMVGAGAVLAGILVVSIVWIVLRNMYSVTLDTMVTPVAAVVKVGENEYAAMGEYKIKPGTYEVVVSAEGFETKTGTLVAAAGETVRVSLYLLPSADNLNWYEEHDEDALILGEILNNETIEKVVALKAENPILEKLPVTVDYFSGSFAERVNYVISYVLNGDNTDFKITVTDYCGNGRELAMTKLAELWVAEGEYEVEYIDASGQTMSGHAED